MRWTNVLASTAAKWLAVTGLVSTALGAGAASAEEKLPIVGIPHPWQINFQGAASPTMERIHEFNTLLTIIIVVISIFVLALVSFIVLRFRASRNPTPSKTSHNTVLEVLWTVVPIMILVVIAVPSFRLLYFADRTGNPEMTIKAIGHQWYWEYQYPDAKSDAAAEPMSFESTIACRGDPNDELDVSSCKDFEESHGRKPIRLLDVDEPLVLPINTNIRILVTGAPEGVIHSFAVPSLGFKTDAIPGRLNETWARIEHEGMYYGQCSELCGRDHGFMPIAVEAVSKEAYDAWVKQKLASLDGGESSVRVAARDGRQIRSTRP